MSSDMPLATNELTYLLTYSQCTDFVRMLRFCGFEFSSGAVRAHLFYARRRRSGYTTSSAAVKSAH